METGDKNRHMADNILRAPYMFCEESLMRDKCRALLERVDPRIKFHEKR